MKKEMKAMLPELPETFFAAQLPPNASVYAEVEIHEWLDKLTEGAGIRYGSELGHVITTDYERGDTHRYLVIPLGEIKKQTPLEIAVEALEAILGEDEYSIKREPYKLIADEALAKIEAAK